MTGDFIDDDESVKAMRETARVTGLTELLLQLRRHHVKTMEALDRERAWLSKALLLLGVDEVKP